MGYWTIVIEGTGAHHNPDFTSDANRMADDLVLRLKAAGGDIRRAAFLFDYKGDDAGDTLPYVAKPWPTDPISVEVEGDPYSVVRIPNGNGIHHFRLAYKGQIEKRGYWHTDLKYLRMQAEHNNEAAAKIKPVSGGAPDSTTTYEDRPAGGVVYRGHHTYEDGKTFDWEENYDLDLGSDVFLSWTRGQGDPADARPIGAVIYYREPKNPSGWMSGGVTFAGADPKWINYSKPDGSTGQRPTWNVEAWEPLTLNPSLLFNQSKHGFIKYGKWVPA